MSRNDPEKAKKAKKIIFFYLLFAILIYFLGIIYAIIIITILAFAPKTIQYINNKRGITPGEIGLKINLGKIFSTLFSLAIFVAVILIISAYWPEPRDRSINNIFKIKSQSGSGDVEFGENSIKLTSNDNRGTEFVLNLIHPNVGWVTLSTDVSAPSEGSTLKVSIIDLNNSAWNVRFSPISISSEIYARYTVIYKLGDYSAWVEDSNKMLKKIEGGRTEYQNKTRKYDIEIKVNVLPNSYIELKDVGILNG